MGRPELIDVDTGLGVRFKLAVDPAATDVVSESVRSGNYALPTAIELLVSGVPRGAAVLDLGANIGTFAVAAAALGYPVVAVEASPRCVSLLDESVRANGFEHLTVVPAAAADRLGTVRFFDNGPFGMVAPDAAPGAVRVVALPPDDVARRFAPDGVGFVKMDIEGSEVLAVRGMAAVLGGSAPPPVFFESNGHTLAQFGQTPADLLGAFAGQGYTSHLLGPNRLTPVGAGYTQFPCNLDYLAFKGDAPAAWRGRVGGGVSVEEQAGLAAAEAAFPVATHRAHAARALAHAPAEVLADRRVRDALALLNVDADPGVRAAMGWYAGG